MSSGSYQFINFVTTIWANPFGQSVVGQLLIILIRLAISNDMVKCARATSFDLPDLTIVFCDSSGLYIPNKTSCDKSNVGMFTCVFKNNENIFILA